MPRITLWNSGRKGADYRFIDRNVSEFFNASGTAIYVHRYEGTYDADGNDTPVTTIQDVVFQENRDRRYSKEIFEMRGCYNVQDSDFDLRQFGFFMGGDTLFIEVHYNDMIALIGRKIMSGDVIELPHMRDDALLDGSEAINKYFVVEDSSKASDGYSSTWWHHIWRLKVSPMTGSQEYADILDKANKDPFGLDTDTTLNDIISTIGAEMEINEAILEEAEIYVKARNFETRQFYFIPGEETGDQLPWIWAGDGVPPNGAELLASGVAFPEDADEGDYFLKTNMTPNTLFRKKGSAWVMQEVDYRMGKWSAMHRLMDEFINQTGTTVLQDGTITDTKISLAKALRPPTDF